MTQSRPEDVPGRLGRRPEMRLRRPGAGCRLLGMALTAPDIKPDRDAPAHRGLTRADVMTAAEVAELLQLPVSTVYYLARRGELPACRLGRTWRFVRPLTSHCLTL